MPMGDEYNTVDFISFESDFAPSGGLAAVMRYLPREMARRKQVILITPFFSKIAKSRDAYSRGDIKFTGLSASVRYGGKNYPIRILEYHEKINQRIYRIYLVHSSHFFFAATDPYVNPGKEDALFDDALFFSTAVPEVLRVIPEEAPFILHLQDWETACVVELVPEAIPHKCVLTLHNPYDHALVKKDHEMSKNRATRSVDNTTVLKLTMPKMVGISTVSQNFADELTTDPLHVRVYAPHLQEILKAKRIIGIENGNFAEVKFPTVSDQVCLKKYKDTRRKELLSLLSSKPGKKMLEKGWGFCDLSDTSIPLFLMFGRDDPRQKGYDVAAESVRRVLIEEGADYARFVFTPIPGQNGIESLYFLKKLVDEFAGSTMVFPFRMDVGYMELQSSASYLLMCSLYEPFGGATEGYANGVPVIARATGGLIQQVYPENYRNLPEDIKLLVDRYHGQGRKATGYLFREEGISEPVADWQGIIRAEYLNKSPPGDPITSRLAFSLFEAMIEAAAESIKSAVDLYKNNYYRYEELVKNGLEIVKEFSWQKAANRYVTELYK
ncbi:MAG: glycogen/starch synthase [Candidatus Odinarchaeota archaeon]